MFGRHLWALCKLALLHTLVSWSFLFIGCISYGRPRWLLDPPLYLFYFPAFLLGALGVDLDPLENPLDLLLNTGCWVLTVYPIWLTACHHVPRRSQGTVKRMETP